MEINYHNPVLLERSVSDLVTKPEGIYVNVTFGGGGHSRALLDRLDENGRLFGFDQDPDALKNKIEDSRFAFIAANFSHLSQYLKFWDSLNTLSHVSILLKFKFLIPELFIGLFIYYNNIIYECK